MLLLLFPSPLWHFCTLLQFALNVTFNLDNYGTGWHMLDVYESVDSASLERLGALQQDLYSCLFLLCTKDRSVPRSPIPKVSCLLFCRFTSRSYVPVYVIVCIDFILVLLFTAELRLFHCSCHLTIQLVCWWVSMQKHLCHHKRCNTTWRTLFCGICTTFSLSRRIDSNFRIWRHQGDTASHRTGLI